MKKINKLILVLSLSIPLFFIGCQKTDVQEPVTPTDKEYGDYKNGIEYCGDPLTYDLVSLDPAGITGGTVTIGNDKDGILHVSLDAASGYAFITTHLFAGAVVPGEGLNNGTGHIYLNDPAFQEHTFVSWPFTIHDYFSADVSQEENCFYVVVHALVRIPTGEVVNVFVQGNYKTTGYFFEYCKQTCEPPPPLGGCETAYAFGDQYAYCFRDINKKTGLYNPSGPQNKNFSQWGWTNEISVGSYNFEIWAGAGQCNLSNGTLVGYLSIDYAGGSATMTYNMINGYVLTETHAYIGDDLVPRKNNGKPTVAPGQYPKKHENLNGATSDTYVFHNLSGDVYVIAHGVVCDE